MSIRVVSGLVVLLSSLAGCAAPEAAPVVAAPTAAPSFYVGGHVTGLKGVGLVLRTANGDHATVTADGEFAFSVPVRNGASYTVSIEREPISPLQTCTVEHAAGRVKGKNAEEIDVTCSTVDFADLTGGSEAHAAL
ncbi:MAG TPA: hypothetical protein VIF62_34140 [Labilithrix sp.]|jgi:hypothetical protein